VPTSSEQFEFLAR